MTLVGAGGLTHRPDWKADHLLRLSWHGNGDGRIGHTVATGNRATESVVWIQDSFGIGKRRDLVSGESTDWLLVANHGLRLQRNGNLRLPRGPTRWDRRLGELGRLHDVPCVDDRAYLPIAVSLER